MTPTQQSAGLVERPLGQRITAALLAVRDLVNAIPDKIADEYAAPELELLADALDAVSREELLALSAPPVHAGEADEAHKHTWELEPRSGITLCSEPTCRVPKMRKHEAEEPWLASDHDDYCESRGGFSCNCVTYIVNSATRAFARDLAALIKERRK